MVWRSFEGRWLNLYWTKLLTPCLERQTQSSHGSRGLTSGVIAISWGRLFLNKEARKMMRCLSKEGERGFLGEWNSYLSRPRLALVHSSSYAQFWSAAVKPAGAEEGPW